MVKTTLEYVVSPWGSCGLVNGSPYSGRGIDCEEPFASVVFSMVAVTVAATVVILAVFLATRFDKASLFGISRLFLIIATVISLSVMTRIGVGVGVSAMSMVMVVTVV